MANIKNELYIGKEYLTIEGANVKHPALSEIYAPINLNKITDSPMEFVGIDLETNHKTGELKLLGFCNDDNTYNYYTQHFLGALFSKIKECYYQKKRLVWWNKLDHFVIYKQFLKRLDLNDDEIIKSLSRFGKISAEFDKEEETWKLDHPPIIEIKLGNFYFGISNVIRSSIQFYFYREFDPNNINRVWAYDIANLFAGNLSQEAEKLEYYSKVDKSAHLVDWDKFKIDKHYREKIVLKSNYLDSRAVKDLAKLSINNFYKIFGYYPTSLISAGSMARAGIVADVVNHHGGDIENIHVKDDLDSIPLFNYKDNWINQVGKETFKDLITIFNEAYSGGYIESVAYGTVKEGYTADIASAYPSIAVNLYDLRGAKITNGTGKPPHIKNSYCFIRGDIEVPHHINYHPITIKHPSSLNKDTNIRAVGEFRASYTIEERDYLITLGAKFTNETWYNIETTGKLSPLARAVRGFLKSRTELRAKNDPAQYTAKTCANSIYGILYEAIRTYILNLDNEVVERGGYRVGEFNNPLYASIITSRVRILISKGCNAIERAGGQPVVIMTDSIFWKGNANMLPQELWREKKTLGYFEKPEKITDLVCLGAGRYEYYTHDGKKYKGKKRGLNIVQLIDSDEEVLIDFSWAELLKLAEKQKRDEKVRVKVRLLVSVGLVFLQSQYTFDDLGLVREDEREVDVIVGHTKRLIPDFTVKDLQNGLIVTKPLLIDYKDSTLYKLRDLMMDKQVLTMEDRKLQYKTTSNINYYNKNKDDIKEKQHKHYKKYHKKIKKLRKKKYEEGLKLGLEPNEAKNYSNKYLNTTK